MTRNYWLDVFTGKSWNEFLANGANVSGWPERRKNSVSKMHIGDYLLCYVAGISRFIGVLEITSDSYHDTNRIWADAIYPERISVKLLIELQPEHALPLKQLTQNMSRFNRIKKASSWSGILQNSPYLFDEIDGNFIFKSILGAQNNLISRAFDPKKFWKYQTKQSLPVPEISEQVEQVYAVQQECLAESANNDIITHDEIQWTLLKLGSDLGLSVWVARNDRNRGFNNQNFQDIPRFLSTLPRQFDENTTKTIERIDVLWLRNDAILAAFEIEHTTQIYSGLLRMSDLIVMQPNIKIELYIVAPDERRRNVMNEIGRPTFARLVPSLPSSCKFIAYTNLKKEIEQIGARIKYTNPRFIDDIAESCRQ